MILMRQITLLLLNIFFMPIHVIIGTLLVDKAYIDFVLDQANAKLRLNCEKISKLEKSCEKIIWPSSSSVSEIILQQNDD